MKPAVLLLLLVLVGAALGQQRPRFPERSLSQLTAKLLRAAAAAAGDGGENVVLSPSSIFVGIGMLYTGMDGDTKEAVREAMRFPADDEAFSAAMEAFTEPGGNGTKFVANMITVSETANIKTPFARGIERIFHGSPYYQDFTRNPERVRRSVNFWVSKRTNEKIRQLMPPGSVNSDTSVVLVNALYFKSDWEEAFDSQTFPSPFNVAGGGSPQVEMMNGDRFVGYKNTGDMEIFAMSFDDTEYKMVFVLPGENSDPLSLLSSYANQLDLLDMVVRPEETLQKVDAAITMPRFTSSMGLELTSLLKSIPGLDQAFAPSANLSKISQFPIRIGNVNHKAVIDVSQSGVEAAAATAIAIVPFANFEPEITITLDRPFLYFIVEEPIGAIHIAGILNDPRNI